MDLQTYLNNAVAVSRQATLANSDQLTLGELILKLEPIVEKQGEDEATVRYDFEYLFPNDIDSWRGSYSELALNFTTEGQEMKVSDFLKMLKDCIGKEFTGYKALLKIKKMETIRYNFNNTNAYIEQSVKNNELRYSVINNSLEKVFCNLTDAVFYLEKEEGGEGVNEILINTTKTIFIK